MDSVVNDLEDGTWLGRPWLTSGTPVFSEVEHWVNRR